MWYFSAYFTERLWIMKRLVFILVIAGVLAAAGAGLSFAEPANVTVLQTGGVSGHLYPCPT
jgi:hypothetical protein